MGRFGFGHSAGLRAHRLASALAGSKEVEPPQVQPSSAWTGIAGSGFASLPVDPVRTTAKPAIRLIVPPNQQFTEELLVGVSAWANDGGSLMQDCGLDRVVVHYEGASVEIAAPSFQTFADANGNPVTYFGWWARLQHNGVHGDAHVYFEAVPRDPSMQHRVIGPYVYFPRAVAVDLELTVAPSLAPVNGQRYQTLVAAMTYLAGTAVAPTFNTARITITEPGSYSPTGGGGTLNRPGKGYVIIEATVPATLEVPPPSDGATAKSVYRFYPQAEPVCFRGGNLTLDIEHAAEIYLAYGRERGWFDGCTIVDGAGRDTLYWKVTRTFGPSIRGKHWFTEATIDALTSPFLESHLVRGCTIRNGKNDVSNKVAALVGNTVEGWNSEWFRARVPAMTVTYAGPGASATIEATTGNPKVFTMKVDGAIVGTLSLTSDLAAHDSGQFHVRQLVEYIDTLSGWSATLLDDSRTGQVLCLATGTVGSGFVATSVKGAGLTLYTGFDLHSDFVQSWNVENLVMCENLLWDSPLQSVTTGDGYIRDAVFINNVLDNPDGFEYYSQDARASSHFVFAHNSWVGQGYLLRFDGSFAPDEYCLFANNVLRSLTGVPGTVTTTTQITVKGNHVMDGAAYGTLTNSANLSQGGTRASLWADTVLHDYAPAGELLDNLKTPVVQFDARGRKRANRSAAGAVA